jgi:hypothetical protein
MPQGLTRIACGRGIAIRQIFFGHGRSQSVDKKGSVRPGGEIIKYLSTKVERFPSTYANRKQAPWRVNFVKFALENNILGRPLARAQDRLRAGTWLGAENLR